MRTVGIYLVVGTALLTGCGGRVSVDEPWAQAPAAIGQTNSGVGGTGEGGSGGDGGEGGAACGGWTSECQSGVDKKLQKVACDDGDPHTVDRCVAVGKIGGVCAHTEAECDNFDSLAVQAKVCDDGDPSTTDRCTKWNACLSKPSAASAAPAADVTE